MSLTSLEGMNPVEARLFTIEARLRCEENSRIQSYNQLMEMINSFTLTLKNQQQDTDINTIINDLKLEGANNELISSVRNTDKRRTSPAHSIAQ